MDPIVKRTLMSLFSDAARRLDALKLQHPGHDTTIDNTYMEGFNLHWRRNDDLNFIAGSGISEREYEAAWQEFNQQRQSGLNDG